VSKEKKETEMRHEENRCGAELSKSISLTLLSNFNFTSTECMLVDVSDTKVVEALRVALDLLAWRKVDGKLETKRFQRGKRHN
jgi:hypothetical protein